MLTMMDKIITRASVITAITYYYPYSNDETNKHVDLIIYIYTHIH